MSYAEEDMLMLSGIQHYMFCPRQWALIHIEQQWDDNRLTIEGRILHENVDNPFYRQKNGDVVTLRALNIASKRLGLYGITDAVELIPSEVVDNSITHPRYGGRWSLFPVEYKHGHAKPDEQDEVQLAAQALCLEEMFGVHINQGALFYFETRHREVVTITEELRCLTQSCADGMHGIFSSGEMPAPIKKAHCRNCSLSDRCMPELTRCTSVSQYLKTNLYEETT